MNIKDILKLSDDNDYIIASKADYANKTYFCLVDLNNKDNAKFCYLDSDEVVIIEKEKLDNILLLKLMNNLMDTLNKESSTNCD